MRHEEKNEISLPTKKQVETERKRYRRRKAYNKALRGTIYVLTIVAAVAVLIATLILPVLQIEGTSMEPTLTNGDIVLLTKTTRFDRADLCGFTWNNKLLIKRVIGLPGDWIEIDTDGTIYLNGDKLEEPYVQQKALGKFQKISLMSHKALVNLCRQKGLGPWRGHPHALPVSDLASQGLGHYGFLMLLRIFRCQAKLITSVVPSWLLFVKFHVSASSSRFGNNDIGNMTSLSRGLNSLYIKLYGPVT